MHAAPSVNYPVGPQRIRARARRGAHALGLLVASAWTLQPAPAGWRQALVFAAAAGCGAVALAAWWRSPTGTLRWNGVAWGWQEGVEEGGGLRAGHPEIALDLQNRLLLRWQAEEGVRALVLAGTGPRSRALGGAAACGIFARQHARAPCRRAADASQ
jgi:hypothetical protein